MTIARRRTPGQAPRAARRGVQPREWIAWFAALAVVTAGMIALRDRLNEAHVALAYLLVVQGGSARGGRPLGAAMAIVAFLCFDLFFLPPFGTLGLQNPLNWIVLAAFLGTSLFSAELLYRAQADRAAALEQAHHAKDVVLASVSHDLRTPLTTIKGLAHEIAEGGDDRASVIEEEADRLSALVGQLLDHSRITSGAAVADVGPNEAEDLLGAAAQQVAGRLNGRELRIKVSSSDALLFGQFDFSQTLRALVNLIENAAKYSPAEAAIDLTAHRDGRWLVFAVADRGPGVPAAEREKIFEPFYRRAGREPDVAGAGLGLSIALGIAQAQGGAIVLSDREGGGTVFSLHVPALTDLADPRGGQ
jgi:K+-sensing histidine kinase KdpD